MKKHVALSLLLGIFLASFVLVGTAGATALPPVYDLAGLISINGHPPIIPCIPVGDKTASNFGYSEGALAAALVFVTTSDTNPMNPGLTFSSLWYASGKQSLNAVISFNVSAPSATIDDVSLSVAGWTKNSGTAEVQETVYADGNTYTMTALAGGPQQTVTFAPTGYISICKDIEVAGNGGYGKWTGSAGITCITQNFSQVPVPPGLLLLAPGLLGLFGMRKRIVK